MIVAVVNTVCYVPFTLLDADGAPETGKVNADWTKTAYLASTPATVATDEAVTETSGGGYVLAFTPTTSGTWYATWSVVVDGETVRFEEIVRVVTSQQDDPVSAFTTASVTLTSPVAETGAIELYQGDDYATADSRSLSWSLTGAPSLSGATITWKLRDQTGTTALTKTATVSGSSPQIVRVQLTDDDTTSLTPSGAKQYRYDLAAVLSNGNKATLARGSATVKTDV